MLAFDIETTGLSAIQGHKITVICTEDYNTREKKAYEFARGGDDPVKFQELREAVLRDFEDARSLCAFNGHRFDLPFMAAALDIPVAQIQAWKAKTTDILESCRKQYNHTFSLNLLCQHNQIPMKTSSGLEAITMAANGEFDRLREYCEYDVTILNNLYAKRFVLNPRNNAVMDLSKWTLPYVYPAAVDETPIEQAAKQLDAKNALDASRMVRDTSVQDRPVKRVRLELPDLLEG